MNEIALKAIPIVIAVVALGVMFIILRKIAKKNRIVKVRERDIPWQSLNCPSCRHSMEPGFSLAGRGIIWRHKNQEKPGTFSSIGSALANTTSFHLQPALNLSWRCNTCLLVLIDYSKMIRVVK